MKVTFVKISMNGERFWAQILGESDNGMVALKSASETIATGNPNYGQNFELPENYPYVEIMDADSSELVNDQITKH